MNKLIIILFLLFTCCYCNQPSKEKDTKHDEQILPALDSTASGLKVLYQNWETEDAIHPQPKDLYSHTDDGIYNFPGMTFLNDSSLTENPRGEIRLGKYFIKDSVINATFSDGGKAIYIIQEMALKNMILSRNENNKKTLLTLKGDGLTYDDAKSDPFHSMYNDWRIKPKQKENTDELKTRLKNYIAFCEAFLKDNLRRKSAEIDFQGIPNCLKWYQGGIFVQSEEKLDPKFSECFYDKSQALQARKIIEDALSKKYKWEKNEQNWVKQIAPVLEQMRDSL